MDFGTVAIVGVGLIGGSLGLALRAAGLASRVVGVGRRQSSLDEALERGAVDQATLDLAGGVAEADVVVFGTPVDLTAELMGEVLAACRAGAVVTDVGSTKRRIVERACSVGASGAVFVGGHPLAGAERRGVAAARADLFDGCTCILTPTDTTPTAAVQRVSRLWQAVGAGVVLLDAAEHDRALAAVSHLPHLAAAAVVNTVAEPHRQFAASGFADATRIALGDPRLWTAIFQHNRDGLLATLSELEHELSRFRKAIDKDDAQAIEALLQQAKRIRDAMAS
jgi:prephenate dehydrogenase